MEWKWAAFGMSQRVKQVCVHFYIPFQILSDGMSLRMGCKLFHQSVATYSNRLKNPWRRDASFSLSVYTSGSYIASGFTFWHRHVTSESKWRGASNSNVGREEYFSPFSLSSNWISEPKQCIWLCSWLSFWLFSCTTECNHTCKMFNATRRHTFQGV